MIKSYYFAHPITMYKTPVESAINKEFEARYPGVHVENPDQPQHTEGYKQQGMDYFVQLCNKQDGVFFSSFADGTIGAGVAKEVVSFLDRKADVVYFDPKSHEFVPLTQPADLEKFPVLSADDTRAHIRQERSQIESGHSPYSDIEQFGQGFIVAG